MPKLPDYVWLLIRQEWEAGESISALSRKYEVHKQTISGRRQRGGWVRPAADDPGVLVEQEFMSDGPDLDGSSDPVEFSASKATVAVGEVGIAARPSDLLTTSDIETPPAPGVIETVEAHTADVIDQLPDEPNAREAELEARIAELEAENTRLNDRVEKLRETVTIELYSNEEEVRTYLGPMLDEMAIGRLSLENLKRYREGKPMLDFSENTPLVEVEKRRIAQELIAERTKFRGRMAEMRCVKFQKPDGTLVEWPMEDQISNMKGEHSAPMAKAREKGWKLIEPYLCQRRGCWLEAIRNDDQSFAYNGYCSLECRGSDPYLAGTQVAGVTTSTRGQLVGR